MSDEKHTPGSWKADGANVFAGRDCIAVCDTDNAPMARMEANARLISAAPDLLDICKRQREELRLIRMKDCGAVYDTTVRIGADLAIDKATIGAAVKKG